MHSKRIEIMGQAPVFNAIFYMATPMILGMLVQIFYNMTDMFFIGMLNDATQTGAAAMAAPIMTFVIAIGGIVGNGGSSYISRKLGAGDFEEAEKTLTKSIGILIYLGVLFGFIFTIFCPQIVTLLGAQADTFAPTYDYVSVLSVCIPISMANFALGQLLRAEGSAKQAMFGMMVGTITNVVLDPIFIFGLGLNVKGAAIATVLGQLAGTLYYLSCYLRKKTILKLKLKRCFYFNKTIYKEILFVGLPSSINQVLLSVAFILANNVAASYGAVAIASMGVAMKINEMAVLVLIGLGMGIQPLIGYSYGAGNYSRLKEILKKSMLLQVAIGIIFFIIFSLYARELIMIFQKIPEVIDTATVILNALKVSIPVLGILFVIISTNQSMGNVKAALLLSIIRQGVIYMPALFLLNKYIGFQGFIYAQPLSDIGSVVIALILLIGVFKALETNTEGIDPTIVE